MRWLYKVWKMIRCSSCWQQFYIEIVGFFIRVKRCKSWVHVETGGNYFHTLPIEYISQYSSMDTSIFHFQFNYILCAVGRE